MPINTTRITAGIYQHKWIGHIIIDEVVRATENMQSLAQADNCKKYIAIVDGSDVRTIPFNITKLSRAFSGDTVGTLIYKAPVTGQILGEIIGTMVKLSVEFYDDRDEMFQRAYQLLEENESSVFQSEFA